MEGHLHDTFAGELREVCDVEHELLETLPDLAKAATSPELKQAFTELFQEMQAHVGKVEEAISAIEPGASGRSDLFGPIADAGPRRSMHSYRGRREPDASGAVVTWAQAMGLVYAVEMLEQMLEEEKSEAEFERKKNSSGSHQ